MDEAAGTMEVSEEDKSSADQTQDQTFLANRSLLPESFLGANPGRTRTNSVTSTASQTSGTSITGSKRKRGNVLVDVDKELKDLSDLTESMQEIKLYLNEKQKGGCKVSLTLIDTMMAKIKAISDLTIRLGLENAQLKGRLQDHPGPLVCEPAYRNALTRPVNNRVPPISGLAKKSVPKKTYATVIKPIDATLGSANVDDMKAKIVSAINPVKNKIKIKAIRKIREGVVVETDSNQDLEKILCNEGIKSSGFVTSLPRKQFPKVIIYDVPTSFTNEDIKEALLRQNEDVFLGMNPEAVEGALSVRFRTGKRDEEFNNCVVEVSAELRNILRRRGRVYIDLRSCKVSDYIGLSRCFRCQTLGHIAKSCNAEKEACGICSDEGHTTKDCPKKEQQAPRKCALCRKLGKTFDHPPDNNCPSYKMALEKQRLRTDYG